MEICRKLFQFGYTTDATVWEEVISKGMERFCRRCSVIDAGSFGEEKAEKPSSAPAGAPQAPSTCQWCKNEFVAKLQTVSQLCASCRVLQFKCARCTKAAKKATTKPLSAFPLERMLKWKQLRTLSKTAWCLNCDDARSNVAEREQPHQWSQATYTCRQCQQDLPPRHFTESLLQTLERRKQLYLATCEDCRRRSQNGEEASEERVQCKHCEQHLPPSVFSVDSRRLRLERRICWACQHPVCSSNGCEERKPIARVGIYTCEKCLYPPCPICGTSGCPKVGELST